MRNGLLAGLVLLFAGTALAQVTTFGTTLPDCGVNGIVARTAADTYVCRTLTSSDGTNTVTNGNAAAGNPDVVQDGAISAFFTSGTSDAAGSCSPGTFHLRTDTDEWWQCTSTDTWTQAGAGGAAAFDPGTTMEYYDDFMLGEPTTNRIATIDWTVDLLSTGSINNAVAGTANNPGLLALKSHASNDNSGARLNFQNSGSGNAVGTVFDGNDWEMDVVLAPGANSSSIGDIAIWIGIINNSLDSLTGGIFIRYDTDRSDATYIFQICDAGGASGCDSAGDSTDTQTIASTIAPSQGVYNRFRIRRVAAGVGGNPTIYMRVNDETELTFCSSGCDDSVDDLPTGNKTFRIGYQTRTTSAVMEAYLDYAYIKVEDLARY